MKIVDSLLFSWKAIWNRKKRSFLTIFGIMVGISAMIALLSLGVGFEQKVESFFEDSFDANMVTISKQESIHSRTDFETKLFVNDSNLLEGLNNVEHVIPIIQKEIYFNNNGSESSLIVYGIPFPDYNLMFEKFLIENGKFPLAYDGTKENTNIVIGARIYEDLVRIMHTDPINHNFSFSWASRLNGTYQSVNFSLPIIGSLKSISGYSFFGAPGDNAIYMDINLAQELFSTTECSMILLMLEDYSNHAIEELSDELYTIYGGNIGILTLNGMIDSVNSALVVVTAFLAAIAAISLIVAGIGIMNTVTITLMERKHEIGILKSLGMKNRTLLRTFLIEIFILAFIGILLGIFLGIIISYSTIFFIQGRMQANEGLLSQLSETSPLNIEFYPIFTLQHILLTSLFGLVISLLFAYFPAKKAAKLVPISAIRQI